LIAQHQEIRITGDEPIALPSNQGSEHHPVIRIAGPRYRDIIEDHLSSKEGQKLKELRSIDVLGHDPFANLRILEDVRKLLSQRTAEQQLQVAVPHGTHYSGGNAVAFEQRRHQDIGVEHHLHESAAAPVCTPHLVYGLIDLGLSQLLRHLLVDLTEASSQLIKGIAQQSD